jgi:integrating conjugative element protein (TIGR03761 family)
MPDRNIDHDALEKVRERINGSPAAPQPLNADKPFQLRPGVLRNDSTLSIKTNLAQQVVFGRPASKSPSGRSPVVGLLGFAGMLKPIYEAAGLDDPYADQRLLEIEAVIERSFQELGELRATVDKLLASRSDVQHSLAHSVRPLQVPLYFSNQFPFRAAYLINDFDTFVCAVQTARFVALLTTTKANALIRRSNKIVRRALASATGYQFSGVSRADILHGTAKARAAMKRCGELPLDILNGTRRAAFGPPLPEGSFASHFVKANTCEKKTRKAKRRRR